MDIHFQRLKAALPVEITAAFFAVKQVVDYSRVDSSGQPAAIGEYFEIMAVVLMALIAFNAFVMRKSECAWGLIVFSSILFFVWAINIDIVRWEDILNEKLGLDPGYADARTLAAIAAVFVSLLATLFSVGVVNANQENATPAEE